MAGRDKSRARFAKGWFARGQGAKTRVLTLFGNVGYVPDGEREYFTFTSRLF